MTTIVQAVILGIVQGITEWLPVSSSGHLVLAQHFFGLSQQIAMDLMLHVATLFVAVVFFRKSIIAIIKAFWKASMTLIASGSTHLFREHHARLGLMIVIATIPTAIIGFLLKKHVEQAFESVLFVAFGLIFTAIVLWLSRIRPSHKDMRWKDALWIGTLQGVAIFPGVSRSGSTISAGLMRGIDPDLAATFSFLLFIPTVIGAFILEVRQFAVDAWLPIITACLTTIIVSFFVLNWLMTIVKKGKFHYFSFYCITVALLIIINYIK